MKVKVTMNQDRLNNWNVPNLKTGDILTVEPSEDGFAYLIVDPDFTPSLWLAIPKSFTEVVKK